AVFPIKVTSTSIFVLLQELHQESIGGDESNHVKVRSTFIHSRQSWHGHPACTMDRFKKDRSPYK
ncbi:hypothetical protein, partial [Microcoleus sp. herbarium14]|uniref:hypothetical protein n=1 Tax=Microcoleus sp. herbarium14 TaxID=3055439 RepID=UPI002FD63D16